MTMFCVGIFFLRYLIIIMRIFVEGSTESLVFVHAIFSGGVGEITNKKKTFPLISQAVKLDEMASHCTFLTIIPSVSFTVGRFCSLCSECRQIEVNYKNVRR